MKRTKRPTRAEKMEASRQAEAVARQHRSKPWWPIPALTEDEAIGVIVGHLDTLAAGGDEAAGTILSPLQGLKLLLAQVPDLYVAKATAARIDRDEQPEQIAAGRVVRRMHAREPNIQNIVVRTVDGRDIRNAFVSHMGQVYGT